MSIFFNTLSIILHKKKTRPAHYQEANGLVKQPQMEKSAVNKKLYILPIEKEETKMIFLKKKNKKKDNQDNYDISLLSVC